MVDDSGSNSNSYFQVAFFSSDKRFANIPEHPFNVPTSSVVEQLNLLVNKAAESENDEWQQTSFDFLISGILLRTDLLEFVENHGMSSESVIKVECIVQEAAPTPDKDMQDSEWVSDLKVADKFLFSVNYGGELSVWNLAKGKKLLTKKMDGDPLKCVGLFEIEKEQHVVVGSQNQTLTMLKISVDVSPTKKSVAMELSPSIIFRGHQRSVECVAAINDGTRIVSGSFDQCLKVWNTGKDDDENNYVHTNEEIAKKAKTSVVTKTPMVTLASHREAVTGVKWNPMNEKQVITVSWDHSIIAWDLELAGPAATMHSNKSFTALSLNSSGLVITGSADPIIRLWDLRSREGSMVKESFVGHQGWVSDLCWAPNADHLFVSASFDNSVKMWDLRSPKASLYDLVGHEERALTVDWSNSSVIASGAADATIKLFRRS